jgi:NADPH-dependent glutamate synthase beta subunit-like oxidoreductase
MMVDLLSNKEAYTFEGRVAIIGGGATAVDCAITAKERGATHVDRADANPKRSVKPYKCHGINTIRSFGATVATHDPGAQLRPACGR